MSTLNPRPMPHDLQLPHGQAAAAGATHSHSPTTRALRWGVLFGVLNAAVPVAFWWLNLATVHAMAIAFIAAVYIGFAVGDGRPRVIFVESLVAAGFFVLAASAVTATPWLLVTAYVAHGLKDLWQHRHQFVRGTRSVAALLRRRRLDRRRHHRRPDPRRQPVPAVAAVTWVSGVDSTAPPARSGAPCPSEIQWSLLSPGSDPAGPVTLRLRYPHGPLADEPVEDALLGGPCLC